MKKYRLYYFWIIFIPFALLVFSFRYNAQPLNNIIKNILFKLETYYNWYPQQKVYLHTDKTYYDASETLWFKAYLVNSSNHRPDSLSTNLYVELIDPGGNIVQQKMLKLEKGFSNGDFSFKDTIPEGLYRLRAFTQLIKNTSKDFYYSKDIYLRNPDFIIHATRNNVVTVKKVTKDNIRKAEKFDVSFLPEGGHLLSGMENTVGFKAINQLGHGVDITGKIVDKQGNVHAEFKSMHAGIGSFTFTPQSGIKYSVLIMTPDNQENKYRMPEAIDQGVTLHTKFQPDGQIKITVLRIFPGNKFPPNTTYFLIAQSRGNPVYTAEFDIKNEVNSVILPKSSFPSGIVHFTLFNAFSKPVSERLVFINNRDELRVNVIPEKSVAGPHEKINLKVQVRDHKGNPVEGNFSLSIAELNDLGVVDDNILTHLLLSSDIKGKIENPIYYFEDYNSLKESELDNLLLTQGWRRFEWDKVLNNEKRVNITTRENYISISGRITKEFFSIPLKDVPVTLTILSEFNDIFTTRSNYGGYFKFTGLQYYDTLAVRVESRRKSGRKNLLIQLDVKSADRVKDMNYVTYQLLKKPGAEGRYKVPVKEVSDDPFFERNTRIERIHSEPRDVIIIDDRFLGYSDVAQVLQGRIPGVMVQGYRVIIRGSNTLIGSTDPLFLVDNIPVEPYNALSMNPSDVERIEVLKGSDAAIYGSRGANGVIAIYTKRGKFMIKGMIEFKMQGYATPKEYYSPKYPYRADDPFIDDRKTILWIPYLMTNSSGEAETSFYTSDIKGNYLITVEGINYKGTPGTGTSSFIIQ